MKACFIILHYLDKSATRKCVDSILRMQNRDQNHIVIVDNDTDQTDADRQILKKEYETMAWVSVLQVREKSGFSRANNLGYRYAIEHFAPEYVIICNNDIEFQTETFVSQIEETYQETGYAVLGPDILVPGTGEHQNPLDNRLRTREEAEYTIRMNRLGLRWYPLLYPLLYAQYKKTIQRKRKSENRSSIHNVQQNIIPCGACLIFSKKFIEQEENAFEPETEFYYEEYILGLRCKKKGYQMVYDPSVLVWHMDGAATKRGYGSEKKRMQFRMEHMAKSCEVYLKMMEKKAGQS